jgi:anti-sigma factor RsiW
MNDSEREEIEKLLPWYVTGKLQHADMTKVETYLALHPGMAAQLDLIRAERQQTVRANEAIGAPAAGMLDRFTGSPPPIPRHLVGGRRLTGLVDFFKRPTARGMQWAAIVVGIIVLAQAVMIAGLLVSSGHTYQVAAGPSSRDGWSALIAFTDDATAPAIARLLADFDIHIVDGPKPGGVYIIRVRTVAPSPRAEDALLRRLTERRDLVRFVAPSRD